MRFGTIAGNQRRHPPVVMSAPVISGTRGGTLTADFGTWGRVTRLIGQWYVNGIPTGNLTGTYQDTNAADTVEFHVIAFPGAAVHVATISNVTGVTYDTSVGIGVDANGFANLPLFAGGTTGADILVGAPTAVPGTITYDAGTRTFTGTASGNTDLGTWTNVLTPGQTYRLQIGIIKTSYVKTHIRDENGTDMWASHARYGYDGSGNPMSVFFDETFVATGHDFTVHVDNDAFTAGASISIGIAAPHSGTIPAHRFFVKDTGSDAINPIAALNPATPLRTIKTALALTTPGYGDQVMLAEGSAFDEPIPLLNTEYGQDAQHPLVFQSYDPTDALNEAKYGRATINKPRVNTGGHPCTVLNGGSIGKNLAFRGFKFDPPDTGSQEMDFFGNDANACDNVLIENVILAHSGLAFDMGGSGAAPLSNNWVIRKCSIYGPWAPGGHMQMLYTGHINGLTIEDCTIWHGWKMDKTRDDDMSVGGLVGDAMFRHSCYLQNTTRNIKYRRNLIVDGNADGGHILGDAIVEENLIIDCPIALDCSGGVSYETVRPNGVVYQIQYNAIIGATDMTSTDPRGIGIWTRNGAPGTEIHHNVMVRANNVSAGNRTPFDLGADAGKPNYTAVHDNVSYLRATSGSTYARYPDPPTKSYIFSAAYNNIWDDPSDSAGNVNAAGYSFPDAYTDADLYSLAGFADKQSLMTYAVAHPEDRTAHRTIYNALMNGYGITHQVGDATTSIPDTTAPVLTSLIANPNSATDADISVNTTKPGGMWFWIASGSATQPTDVQIKAGLDSTGAAAAGAGAKPVVLSGTVTDGVHGLTAGGTYYLHAYHEDAWANKSGVVSSASFTFVASGLGPELNPDPNFANPATWQAMSGWTVSGGKANAVSEGFFLDQPNSNIHAGHSYHIVMIVDSITGHVCPYLGSNNDTTSYVSAPGTYTFDLTPTGGNWMGLRGLPDALFTGSVSYLSVKENL